MSDKARQRLDSGPITNIQPFFFNEGYPDDSTCQGEDLFGVANLDGVLKFVCQTLFLERADFLVFLA